MHSIVSKFILYVVSLLYLVLFSMPVAALENTRHPLAPPDTNSPRSTLLAFLNNMNQVYNNQLQTGHLSREGAAALSRAMRCLDLSEVARSSVREIGDDSAYLLKEILDRIEIPPLDEIPGIEAVKNQSLKKWTIPYTEIVIKRITEGEHEGEFLFSANTVNRAKSFYERVKHLPYKPGASVDAYDDFISLPGPLIPGSLINILPKWSKVIFLEQTLWKWVAFLFVLGIGYFFNLIVFRLTRSRSDDESETRHWFTKAIFPLTLSITSLVMWWFINSQINLSGYVLDITHRIFALVFYISSCWTILSLGRGISESVVSSTRKRIRSLDANAIRIVANLITIAVLVVFLWNVADYWGIPVHAVLASAGIAGLAVALAGREALANILGGLSLLTDRPFKGGDYIVLESGERGEVVDIGLRSTRIITRDDVQISIPNHILTNSKIINESAPKSRFRVHIEVGVAYGTDVDNVEKILLGLAIANPLAADAPEPRVRFRRMGDSSLDFDLLCWAHRPHDKGKLTHQLNRDIYTTFKKVGIEIPFPQRDVHLIQTTEK
ncbi:MAG: mechanosensitive ion channel family protein [Desulfobacterales bacterium]